MTDENGGKRENVEELEMTRRCWWSPVVVAVLRIRSKRRKEKKTKAERYHY